MISLLPTTLAALALLAAPEADGLTLTPENVEHLEGFLRELAETHQGAAYCATDCGSILRLEVSGRLAEGRLSLSVTGNVHADKPTLFNLVGAGPAVRLDDLSDASGKRLATLWTGRAWAVALPPGAFRLRGNLVFGRGAPVSLFVPGPVGEVVLQVADADVVGTSERRAVSGGTYQLATKLVEDAGATTQKLRLRVERRFHLARDKTFEWSFSAQGARPGEIIALPLPAGARVESFDPTVVTLRPDAGRLDWVATSREPTLELGGSWLAESIALEAPGGSVSESWSIVCDDPYICSFTGDAESKTGATGHLWEPLAGQKLVTTWKELATFPGVHTAAQSAALATRQMGESLRQTFRVHWMSSSGSLVSLGLPEGAVVHSLLLDETAVPILRDTTGLLQVSLPAGRSILDATWDVPNAVGALLRPPLPRLSQPVATLWQGLSPPESAVVLWTGGMPGSPRVALWPNLGACLVVAMLLWFLARRGGQPLVSTPAWLAVAAGYAIISPAAVVPFAALLGLGRWMGATNQPRGRFRAFVDLSVLLGVLITTVVVSFVTLETALFSSQPIEVESFVYNRDMPNLGSPQTLLWAAFLAGAPGSEADLPRPFALTLPLIIIRLVWAAWAVSVGLLAFREGRLGLAQLRNYWSTVEGPAPKPAAPASKAGATSTPPSSPDAR